MAYNKIPEVLNDMRVYLNGNNSFIGATSIELPEAANMTATVAGIGVAGEIEAPVHGHYQSMQTTINYPTNSETHGQLMGGKPIALDSYGDTQLFDSATNEYVHEKIRVVVRGRVKSSGLGTWQAGNTTGSTTVIETHYLKIEINDKVVREIDKYGYKDIDADSVDALEVVRSNLGMN